MPHKNIILDMSNLAWIVRFGEKLDKTKKEPFVKEMIAMKLINFAGDLAIKFKADSVLAAYDSKRVWRKTIYADYKNRDHDDIYYEDVKEAIDLTKTFFDEYTSVKTSKVDHCEADDIIAVACQECDPDVENIIISSDKDFMQLLNEKTTLFSTNQDTFREVEDTEYFLFEKCIRGDPSDNIFSAFPRVRKTLLEKAYNDPEQMLSLMETVKKDGKKVVDDYEFNRTLIDLTRQPTHIRQNIIDDLMKPNTVAYNQMTAVKFAKENKIKSDLLDSLIGGRYKKPFSGMYKFK